MKLPATDCQEDRLVARTSNTDDVLSSLFGSRPKPLGPIRNRNFLPKAKRTEIRALNGPSTWFETSMELQRCFTHDGVPSAHLIDSQSWIAAMRKEGNGNLQFTMQQAYITTDHRSHSDNAASYASKLMQSHTFPEVLLIGSRSQFICYTK